MIAGLPDDEGSPYGLGVWITDRDGHQIVGHSGGMVGYVAQMLCDMDAGIGVIALANGPGGARTVAEYALDLARAASEGAALPDPPADAAADLMPYVGRRTAGRVGSPSMRPTSTRPTTPTWPGRSCGSAGAKAGASTT
jgi:hypothetical protein